MGVRFFPTVIASMLGTLIALSVAFFLFILMLAGLASTGQDAPSVKNGSVLIVPISGFVPESVPENPLAAVFGQPDMMTLHEITAAIRKAAYDDRIAGLWLQPEGSMNAWASLEEIRSALLEFRASGKPLIASSGAAGYSERDYFLASSAELVFSPPAASFEMNGFVIVLQFLSRLLEKLDVDVEAIRAGNFKSAVEPFTRERASDENRLQIRSILEAHSGVFTAAIAEHRTIQPARLQSLMDEGSVTTSEAAYDVGLIDSLMVDDEVEIFFKERLDNSTSFSTISVSDYPVSGISINSSGSDGTIAVVNILGTIMPGRSGRETNPLLGDSDVGSETVAARLRKLRGDDSIDAIVIRINSPGGSAAASDVIWRAIARTGEVKPVIASMGDVAASGGYYIATAADTIVAEPTTITGSIGVFSLLLDISGLLEDKIGLTHDAVTTSPHADMLMGLRPLTDRERTILTQNVDDTYERFTGIVSNARSMDIERVREVAQGRIWSGEDARRLGLVDTLGGLDTAISLAAASAGLDVNSVRIRVYPRPQGFLEAVVDLMESTKADVFARFAQPGPGQWFIKQARSMEALHDLHGNPQARLPVSLTIE